MLPKDNRLKNKKDFERIFKLGKSYKEDFLYLKLIKNNLKNSRFGFIVSSKVSKKAVIRNQIRRRLRELVRIMLPEIKKKIDAVIIIKPNLKIIDFWELEKKIKKLFKKAGIMTENKK